MSDCAEEEHVTTFQGRASALMSQTVQLFGAVAPPPTPYQSTYLPAIGPVSKWDCCDCGLWMLQCSVLEIQRQNDEGNISPLTPQAFSDPNTLPAGAQLVRRSQLKLRVTAGVGTANRRFDMDVGQSLEINADKVCVDWLAPTNFYEVPTFPVGTLFPVPAPPTRSGFVIDVWLGVSLVRLEEAVGDNEVTLTTHLFVPANTLGVIQVPPFATKVTVYQDPTLGASAGIWQMLYGDPVVVGTIPHGAIPFIPGARKSEPDIDLADTTHLQTDLDNADRFFTMRWTIRP